MVISTKDLSSVKKSVEIEVPADAVRAELSSVTTEFVRQAKIPGFRAGKVPLGVVRTRFQKEIQEEVVERLLPRYFAEAVREKGMVPVGSPHLTRVDTLAEGQPFRFEAEFEIRPEFELQEYSGYELKKPATDVSEDDVDSMVERFRDQASTFRPVEDRVSQDGDYVIMDIDATGEGVEPRHSEMAHVQLGEATPLPELHEAVRGKKPGDTASFDKSYGDDAQAEELRGKTVHYEIVVRELRTREKPALDDAFATSVGFESVEAMRQRMRDDLQNHRDYEAKRTLRQEAGDKIAEAYSFEVPEVMIEEELGNGMRNYARFLSTQGIDLEGADIDWEKVRADFRPDAEKRAKRGLVLDAIAKKENITVSDADVDAEIRKAISESKSEFAEVKARLRHDGGYEALRASIAQDRALDFVVDQAKIIA